MSIQLSWALLLVSLVSASIATSSSFGGEDLPMTLDRAAPWWEALRDESYYKRCHSSCTDYSKGVATKVELCDDTEVCRGKKSTFDEFASRKCSEWKDAGEVPDVSILPEGKRFKHEPAKGSWISCAIFCRTGLGQWYSPRVELGRGAFYPDGTWCHRDSGGRDHFCQKNLCLPEGYAFQDAVRAAHLAMDSLPDSFIEENVIIDA